MNMELLHAAEEYARECLPAGHERFPFRNRFSHTRRVYAWAMRINAVEHGNEDVVALAAMLHDIGTYREGERPHAHVGAEMAREFLVAQGAPRELTDRVCEVIYRHSDKQGDHPEFTAEDKIMIDADLLDEVGALAVLWDAMATAMEPEPSYDRAYVRISHYSHRLEAHYHLTRTAEGRCLFAERLAFSRSFIDNCRYEMGS